MNKTFVLLALCLVVSPCSTAFSVALPEESPTASVAFSSQESSPPPMRVNTSTGSLVLVPKFIYTHNNSLSGMGEERNMKSDSGRTVGGGFAVVTSRKLADWITLGLIYEYTYVDYSGGKAVPKDMHTPMGQTLSFEGETEQWMNAHTIGANLGFDLGNAGAVSFSALQAFSYFDGSESVSTYLNGALVSDESRPVHERTRVTVFSLGYTKGFGLTESLIVSPYLGYSGSYVHISDLNNFEAAVGSADQYMTIHNWTHYLLGGLSFEYKKGFFSARGEAGVSRIMSDEKICGYVVRPTGLAQSQAGYYMGADKTVATFGLGASYVFPGFGIVTANYSGLVGENINGHSANVGLVIPF